MGEIKEIRYIPSDELARVVRSIFCLCKIKYAILFKK